MARQASTFNVNLNVQYVPIPEERMGAWCAGLLLLVDLLHEELEMFQKEFQDDELGSDLSDSDRIAVVVDGDALVANSVLEIDA